MKLTKDIIINKYFPLIQNQWNSTRDDFPDFFAPIEKSKRIANEVYLETCINTLLDHKKTLTKDNASKWRSQTQEIITNMLVSQSIMGEQALSKELIDSCSEELIQFLVYSRKMARSLSIEDLGQAIRNYMVFAMFKEMNQTKTPFSYAAFGYSMLYPFTDNYIDNPHHTAQKKQAYNDMIRNKIAGQVVKPKTKHEKRTCDFLDAIAVEFPRNEDDTIFVLLDMMLTAQVESLKQQSQSVSLSTNSILEISVCKGGLSVLIDRYLIKKEVSEEDAVFYLAFGLYLQFCDDLQDIQEDQSNGSQTVFTFCTEPSEIERITNRLLHFVHDMIAGCHLSKNSFLEFVLSCCYQLVFGSIMRSKQYFSKEYIEKIEELMPVSTTCNEQLKLRFKDTKGMQSDRKIYDLLDKMLEINEKA